jgi:AmmeMemoRadiSam system protein A
MPAYRRINAPVWGKTFHHSEDFMAETGRLDQSDQTELLRLARATLQSYLSSGTIPEYHTSRLELRARCGAFVSLHLGSELRGCIGQIVPDRELFRIVQHCAVSAAAEDMRFSPVTPEELEKLTIEISVLTPMRRVRETGEIEIGKHGIYIARASNRGLLLPQVATEYAWDRETFLNQTCRKAGLSEDAWKDPSTVISIFEAQVFSEEH